MGRMRARLRSTTQAVAATLSIPVSVSVLPDWYIFDVAAFVLPSSGSSRPANEGEVSIEIALLLELEPAEIWGPPTSALTDASGRASLQISSIDLAERVLRILATHVASGAAVWKTLTINARSQVTWLGSSALSGGSAMPSDFKQPEPGGERDYRAPYERAGMGWRGR